MALGSSHWRANAFESGYSVATITLKKAVGFLPLHSTAKTLGGKDLDMFAKMEADYRPSVY